MIDITKAKPFYSVLVLAFFCSMLVAGAAVGLRPFQEKNRLKDQKKNILLAAGLYDEKKSIEDLFATIDTKVVELSTGRFVTDDSITPALLEETGKDLTAGEDIAKIRRLEKYALIYLVKKNDEIKQIILPVRGKGLWSTMYGYLAIEADFSTIGGISFYQHGETPGLGGEIANPNWQSTWSGKKIYDESGEKAVHIGKDKGKIKEIHQIDGLSGATLTTDGVDDLITFWFGENGFKPFLQQMKKQGGKNGRDQG